MFEKMSNTTYLIRNVTTHAWYCTSVLATASRYWEARVGEYNNDVAQFFLSMLQNVLAQVISVFNLYKSLEDNTGTGNTTGVHYDAARLVRMAIIFEAIEPVDEDLDRIGVPTAE